MTHTVIPGVPETHAIAKAQAKRLGTALKPTLNLKHGQLLELVARTHGHESWGHLSAAIDAAQSGPAPEEDVDAPDPVLVGHETLRHLLARFSDWARREGVTVLTTSWGAEEGLRKVFAHLREADALPKMTEAEFRAAARTALGTAGVVPAAIDLMVAGLQASRTARFRTHRVEHEAFAAGEEPTFPITPDTQLFDGRHTVVFKDGNATLAKVISVLRSAAERQGCPFYDLGTATGRNDLLSALVKNAPAHPILDPADALNAFLDAAPPADDRGLLPSVVFLPMSPTGTTLEEIFEKGTKAGVHICVLPDERTPLAEARATTAKTLVHITPADRPCWVLRKQA